MKYYTVKEAAKKAKVSEGHMYELVKRGEIKKKEGERRIKISSIELRKLNQNKEYFSCNKERVQIIETHLGKVRKIKNKDAYVISDLAKVLGLSDSYSIARRLDEKEYTKLSTEQANEYGLDCTQKGILLITYKGILLYSKKSRSKNIIDFDRLFEELRVSDCEQIEFKETKNKGELQIVNMFEGHKVEIIIENGEPLFELYSTGMALGYAKKDGKTISVHGGQKLFPRKDRIDKVVKNAEISTVVHGVQQYLTEEELYDFMLEARTEKCKSFRKWVTNEVLPTIRKTGGYVDNEDKFTDSYFSNFSTEVKQAIKQELVNRNKELVNRKKELIEESKRLKKEYDMNNKVIEQLVI
ncbi:BRO family protein [Clostridium baratii]|uniref:BRO family protein n=1 Tax=Clostridium baratii TaxID=1561 RepID=UPI0030D34A7B